MSGDSCCKCQSCSIYKNRGTEASICPFFRNKILSWPFFLYDSDTFTCNYIYKSYKLRKSGKRFQNYKSPQNILLCICFVKPSNRCCWSFNHFGMITNSIFSYRAVTRVFVFLYNITSVALKFITNHCFYGNFTVHLNNAHFSLIIMLRNQYQVFYLILYFLRAAINQKFSMAPGRSTAYGTYSFISDTAET